MVIKIVYVVIKCIVSGVNMIGMVCMDGVNVFVVVGMGKVEYF